VLAAVGRDEVGRRLAAMAGSPDAGLRDGSAAQGGLGRGHQEGGGVQHLGGLVQGQIQGLGVGRLRQQGDGLADLGGVVDFQGQVQALLALGRGEPFVLGQGTNTDDGRGLYHFGDRVRRAARLEPDDPGRRGRYWLMQAVQRRRPVPGHPGHHRIFCGTFSTVLGTKS